MSQGRSDDSGDSTCLVSFTQEDTVVSGLPLLFAGGYPTCLDTMTEPQLETFIPFMVHCALGINPYANEHVGPPPWWPCTVQFMFPLVEPPIFASDGKWTKALKSLVRRCYEHHTCQLLLEYSEELAATPATLLRFINRGDGTTELRNKRTSKLLVTFRNENRDYDKSAEKPRRHRQLLPPTHRTPTPTQPADVYLCDSCDTEFDTLAEAKNHEATVHRIQPRDDERKPEREARSAARLTAQAGFLLALDLHETDGWVPAPPPSKRRVFSRPGGVAISSPLGIALRGPRAAAAFTVTAAARERVERHCREPCADATLARTLRKLPPANGRGTHAYSFSASGRGQGYGSINIGLNRRSRLLLGNCKNSRVMLKKLTDSELKNCLGR